MNEETMRDFIKGFRAIKDLTLLGLFDAEEAAIYEHNLLYQIIHEFEYCCDSVKEVKNEN